MSREFPPGCTEADVRWITYLAEGDPVARIAEVVDYMNPGAKYRTREPEDEVWVCPLDDSEHYFGPMGALVRARMIFPTRAAAIADRVETLAKKVEAIRTEAKKWAAETGWDVEKPCLCVVDANMVRQIAAEWMESGKTSNVGQQLFLLLATAEPVLPQP